MSELDELFGEGAGAPAPRAGLVIGLLGAGLLLAFFGMVCTAAPGGALVLFAWVAVEKEMDRVDSGYLPPEAKAEVQRLRTFTYAGVLIVVGLFLAQGVLFCDGFYQALWTSALERWAELR